MKDSLGREIITPGGQAPAAANLPVKVVTPSGVKDGWMNGNTAVITDKKSEMAPLRRTVWRLC